MAEVSRRTAEERSIAELLGELSHDMGLLVRQEAQLAKSEMRGTLARVATDLVSRSRAKYYPGSSPLHVRLVHTPDGRLLGGQLAGREGAAKRIDVLATALYARLTVADVAALDLSYAPPFAPVYDPVVAVAAKAARSVASTAGSASQPAASTMGGSS